MTARTFLACLASAIDGAASTATATAAGRMRLRVLAAGTALEPPSGREQLRFDPTCPRHEFLRQPGWLGEPRGFAPRPRGRFAVSGGKSLIALLDRQPTPE